MKVRSDFVSNSSSCSFIIEERAGDALAAFCDATREVVLEWGEFDEMGAIFTVGKDSVERFRKELEKGGLDEDEISVSDSYYGDSDAVVRIDAHRLVQSKFGKDSFRDVKRVRFDVDNASQDTFVMYFMYLFFVRAGFAPDKSDTENSFDQPCELIKALSNAPAGDLERYSAKGGKRKETT